MDVAQALDAARRSLLTLALTPASRRVVTLRRAAVDWDARRDDAIQLLARFGIQEGRASDDVRSAVEVLHAAAALADAAPDALVPRGVVVADAGAASFAHLATIVGACVPAGVPLVLVAADHLAPWCTRLPGVQVVAGSWIGVPRRDDVIGLPAPGADGVALVLPHADVEAALSSIAATLWRDATSRAGSPGRVLVPADLAQDLAFALQRRTADVRCAPAADPGAVERALAAGAADGAMLLGGDGIATPAVVLCADPASTLLWQPLAAPVLAVVPYGDEQHAVALANRWQAGVARVHGIHGDHTRRVARALTTPVVAVNDAPVGESALLRAMADRIARPRRILTAD